MLLSSVYAYATPLLNMTTRAVPRFSAKPLPYVQLSDLKKKRGKWRLMQLASTRCLHPLFVFFLSEAAESFLSSSAAAPASAASADGPSSALMPNKKMPFLDECPWMSMKICALWPSTLKLSTSARTACSEGCRLAAQLSHTLNNSVKRARCAYVSSLPVQVHPCDVAPVRAVRHAVGIQHGHQLEHEPVSQGEHCVGGGERGGEAALAAQVAGGGAGAQQEIDEAAGDVRVTGDTPRHSSHTSHRIIHEALGSPGCTRAVMTATVFASKGEESAGGEGWGPSRGGLRGRKGPVMVTRSQGMRQGDRHRHDTCTCSFP